MSRKRPPSIDFYYEDFYSGTMGMHPLAVGMYIRTICFQLAHDSVPEEPRKLCQILGVTPDEFHEHWGEVQEKLTQRSDGSYVNERAQVEMEKKLALSEVRSKCGQKGGRPSKANGKLKVKQNESKTKAHGKLEVGSRKKEDRKKEEGSRKEEKSPFPASIDTPAFRDAWQTWEAHRKEIKKPLTPTSMSQQLKRFAEWGVDRSIVAIEYTIEKGWQGIREPDGDNRFGFAQQPTDTRSTYELIHGRCTGLSDCKCDKCNGVLE